jgi:hypothetical protein
MTGAGPRLGGEPEPRWARRPWRAERRPWAASCIVPPAARAPARRGRSASADRDGAHRGRRALPGNCPPARSSRRRRRCGQTTARSARPGRADLPAARRDRPSGRLAVAALVAPLGIVSSSLCRRVSSCRACGAVPAGLVAPGSPIGPASPLSLRPLRSRRACGSRAAGCARIALLALRPWRATGSGRAGRIAGGSVTGWPLQPVRVLDAIAPVRAVGGNPASRCGPTIDWPSVPRWPFSASRRPGSASTAPAMSGRSDARARARCGVRAWTAARYRA